MYPPIETPVLCMYNGRYRILERRTETPNWEETFKAFDYWDDPENDGQEIDDSDVTQWMYLPLDMPAAEIVQDENGYLTTQWSVPYVPNKGDKLYLLQFNYPPQTL